MSQWLVSSQRINLLLAPLPVRQDTSITDNDDWLRCPICNADHQSCFTIPGVTNAQSPA